MDEKLRMLRIERLEAAGIEMSICDLQKEIDDLERRQQFLQDYRMKIYDIRQEIRKVVGILRDAAAYGRWNVGRGSLLTSYLKQERMQQAKKAVMGLQAAIMQAENVEDRESLAAPEDLEKVRHWRGWDIFLHNIFTEWNLQDEIETALSCLYRFDGKMEEKEKQLTEQIRKTRIQQEDLEKQC